MNATQKYRGVELAAQSWPIWVLGLAVSDINGSNSNCKLMSPEHFFHDKFAIPLHPVCEIKTLYPKKNYE